MFIFYVFLCISGITEDFLSCSYISKEISGYREYTKYFLAPANLVSLPISTISNSIDSRLISSTYTCYTLTDEIIQQEPQIHLLIGYRSPIKLREVPCYF